MTVLLLLFGESIPAFVLIAAMVLDTFLLTLLLLGYRG
jgi:hypothetical protein